MEKTTLDGKWDDEFVQMLGALEHCDEVLTLHRAACMAKAEQDRQKVSNMVEQEMCELADLFCILHKMWDWDTHGFQDIVEERMKQFRG